MPTPEPRFPARFAAEGFAHDIASSAVAGADAARSARREYERDGIPRSHLMPCESEGRDGTELQQCFKTYIPQAGGQWGMVFKAQVIDGRPRMDFLAFGVRHHPKDSQALTVYEIAHRRLHSNENPESAKT